ncbi:DUF3140 domain-containing protein [Phenylobacterium immobile]|uniref:DUF3140 domain-containing protein n=1 Tax=Phenylobacterium immobile TaxID=21 RepID=UPI000A43CA94|nr:DUF3140 domain-containing protein [Phenylobacterium immobile]
MRLTTDDEEAIRAEFRKAVNMSAAEIKGWLTTDESKKVGMTRRGETESVGRQSARRIIAILDKTVPEFEDVDYAHMRKVVGYCRRHLAQRPAGETRDTRWRWSLMNWGHDPLKRD